MTSSKRRDAKVAEGCGLLCTGHQEPLALVSRMLRRRGVRIGRINDRTNVIEGRIGDWKAPYSCKVKVRLYPHRQMSLIDIVCEGSRRRPGSHVLSSYLG